MKTILHIALWCLVLPAAGQQYYVRGEVRDESGKLLSNVSILQLRTGYLFRSGSSGTFGILAQARKDSLRFSLPGFYPQQLDADADQYLRVTLKALPVSQQSNRNKLSSLTRDLEKEVQKSWYTGNETYASLLENNFVSAHRFPSTGISLNVDRASYSNIRRFITLNTQVPPDAVRIEEMLNYFNFGYEEPAGTDPFRINTTLTSCPWNPEGHLYYIRLSARKLNLDSLPPSHLVFLIDISGSMDMPNRLPLIKSSFRLLAHNLRAKDSVTIVVYGGLTGVLLNCTSGADRDTILKVIDALEPGGNTPGESGIKSAYQEARSHFIKGGNNRIILATDGDFNVGLKTDQELEELIVRERDNGIYLTCLGVGMGNYKDSKIQVLAEKGNGNFAYLDNYREAEKVLMKEFTQMLYAVADNVYMDLDFNPAYVQEYRLLGFDNKVGALRDSMSNIEGGEIGSGQSLLALVEVIPTAAGRKLESLPDASAVISGIRLRYQYPGKEEGHVYRYTSPYSFRPMEALDSSFRFSAAIAMYGSLLRSSRFLKNAGWNELWALAAPSIGSGNPLQREFVELVQQSRTLYLRGRKKKGGASRPD